MKKVFKYWYILIIFLPLLWSINIKREFSKQQADILENTSPLLEVDESPSLFGVAWVQDLGEEGLYGGTSDNLIFVARYNKITALNKLTGEVVWSRSIEGVKSLRLFDQVLVVGASWTDLYGLDPIDGEILWHRSEVNPVFGRDIVVGSEYDEGSTIISLLDLSTGETVWESDRLEGRQHTILAKVNNEKVGPLVVLAVDSRYLALDGGSGQEVWSLKHTQNFGNTFIDDNYLVLETVSDSEFCIVRLIDGKELWCSTSFSPFYSEWIIQPAFSQNMVVMKVDRFKVIGIDMEHGKIEWTFELDDPPQPLTWEQSAHRFSALSVLNDKAYPKIESHSDENNGLYALDIHSGKLLWKNSMSQNDLFDVQILAHTPQKLFVLSYPTAALVIDQNTGQVLGRINDLGTTSFWKGASTIVSADESEILVYGQVHGDNEPEVPNSMAGPKNKILLRLAQEINPQDVAELSQRLWKSNDQFSAWYTLEIGLRNSGYLEENSAIATTCQLFLKEQLDEMKAKLAQEKFHDVIGHFTHYGSIGNAVGFAFHPMALLCPNSEQLLAEGYFLAGEAFAKQHKNDDWYARPIDNPYYRQFIHDLPDSPQLPEALARWKTFNQSFLKNLIVRQLFLIGVAITLPLLFLIFLPKGNFKFAILTVVVFFNLLIAGPIFDNTTLEQLSLAGTYSMFGNGFSFGLRQIQALFILGGGCLLSLIISFFIPALRQFKISMKIFAIGFVNSLVMVTIFTFMFG
ncbi:MAG TPA: PQQ-binding-like beta-propeller repeat protein [Anaerolineae bacterium]|nr:PQQ-binding-like beta-propeller repeat protein [Anaerolineae bacterium]